MRNLPSLLALVSVAACGPTRQPTPKLEPVPTDLNKTTVTPVPATNTAGIDPVLLQTLAVLATRKEPPPDAIAVAKSAIDSNRSSVARYIESLVATDDFANQVAPLAVLRQVLSLAPAGSPASYNLQHTDEPDPLYYLDEPACARKTAVRVHPWWAPTTEVLVCPDAYKPTQWMGKTKKGDLPMACLALSAPFLKSDGHGERCGCGPNLVRCFKDRQQMLDVLDDLRQEMSKTVGHIVRAGRPAEDIFTTNETWRGRYAEFVRVAQVIESRQDSKPDAAITAIATWPDAGKWAPRDEISTGQHAGLLTAPPILYNQTDLRQRMTVLYDMLWCMQPKSIGATPESVISLRNPNFQFSNAGWKELAARPICTTCHARLDYGLQFFTGWPNGNERGFFHAKSAQTGNGPLYGADIDDARGSAPLTPLGFAKLAVAQPEFRQCMAKDIGAYVFGNRLTPSRLAVIVKAAETPGGVSLRTLMRTALEQLAADWTSGPVPAPVQAVVAAVPGDQFLLSAEQRRELDSRCVDCHDEAPLPVFTTQTLPRSMVVRLVDDVAFGRMPKDNPLDEPERRRFLETFIPALWSGQDAAMARSYFVDRMAALPAYRPEVALDLIHARVGKHGSLPWRMMEKLVAPEAAQATPGLIMITGMATLEACHAAYTSREDVVRCMENSLKMSSIVSQPK